VGPVRDGRLQPRIDRVADEIRDAVRRGRYVPGQRLVEADLTAELGVSRPSLREALRRLAGEGLITIQPYQGATVRRWSHREIDEIFDVRELLEPEAARLATVNVERYRARFEASRRVIAECAARPPNPLDYDEENSRLHDLILEASGNRLLVSIIDSLHIGAVRHQAGHLWTVQAIQRSAEQHLAVIDRILATDSRGAEQAMRRHVRSTRRDLLAVLERQTTPFGGSAAPGYRVADEG
jgi:DNA-binding GntR family transcriptional regulator